MVVKKGGGSFHHGWTRHGSAPNESSLERRALVVHCISSEARFVPENIAVGTGPIYGRYRYQTVTGWMTVSSPSCGAHGQRTLGWMRIPERLCLYELSSGSGSLPRSPCR
ncbi:MAG: hypothetical protein CM1200mP20_08420 [Pseudomonadota bacterium]|nr:MAG: hypothetical protein CM1200mP20_08420 [Pseudomonadota bacterium]